MASPRRSSLRESLLPRVDANSISSSSHQSNHVSVSTPTTFNEVSFDDAYIPRANLKQTQAPESPATAAARVCELKRRCKCCCGGCLISKARCALLSFGITAVLLTTILLIGLYAIVPLFINSQLEKSTLTFYHLDIDGAPTNTSMPLHSEGGIANVLDLKAHLDDCMLYLYQTQGGNTSSSLQVTDDGGGGGDDNLVLLGSMIFPAMTLHGPTNFTIDSTFNVGEEDAFNAWVKSIIFNGNVTWIVKADVTITPYLWGVKLPSYSGIHYEKDITIQGCSGLKDVQLLSFDMTHSDAGDLVVSADISLYNPSLFELQPIGDLHFNFFYQNVHQGSLRSIAGNNTSLFPGENVFSFFGSLVPDPCCPEITHDLVQRYLTGLNCTVEARPDPTDGSSIEVYNQALTGLNLPTTLPGLTGSLITDVEVISAAMTPSETDDTIQFEMVVGFTLLSPLGPNATMNVVELIMDVDLYYFPLATPNDPVKIGSVYMQDPGPVFPRDPKKQNHTLQFKAIMAATLLITEPVSNYAGFVGEFVSAVGLVPLEFRGLANATATYLYGTLHVPNINIHIGTTMQGGQGLNGTMDKSLSVIGNREGCGQEYCGVNVEMVAEIYNPSALTLNLSNSWFGLYWNNARMGALEILPLYMIPGENPDVLSVGFLNPAQEDLPIVAQFLSDFVAGVNHTVTLKGLPGDPSNAAMDDGALDMPSSFFTHSPNKLNDPLSSAHSITLSAIACTAICRGQQMQLLQNFDIKQFILEFHAVPSSGRIESLVDGASKHQEQSNEGVTYLITTSAIVHATVVLPPSLQMPLTIVSTDVDFSIRSAEGIEMGNLPVASFPVDYEPGSNTSLILSFQEASFTVTNASAFSAFASQMVSTTGTTIVLDGFANPDTQTNMGPISLKNIHQRDSVGLIGYNSFLGPDGTSLLKLLSLDILAAHANPSSDPSEFYSGGGSIELTCNVTLVNPSQVAIRGLGLFQLDMYYSGVRLATVSLANFSVELGLNVYDSNCRGTFWNPLVGSSFPDGWSQQLTARQFLSDYLNGIENVVSLSGMILQPDGTFKPGTDIPYLQPAFSTFHTDVHVPPNEVAFIQELIVSISWQGAAKIIADGGGIVPAQARLFNPFSTAITVTNMNLSVLAGNLSAPVGGWLVPMLGTEPISLAPHSGALSPDMPVWLIWDPPVIACLLAIFLSANHSTGVSLVGDLAVWIDDRSPVAPDPRVDFNQTMEIASNLIPTTLGNITFVAALGRGSEEDVLEATLAEDDAVSRDRDSVLDWIQGILFPTKPDEGQLALDGPSPICPLITLSSLPPRSLSRQAEDLQRALDAESEFASMFQQPRD